MCPYCGYPFHPGDVLRATERGSAHRICEDRQLELQPLARPARPSTATGRAQDSRRPRPDALPPGRVGAADADELSEAAA